MTNLVVTGTKNKHTHKKTLALIRFRFDKSAPDCAEFVPIRSRTDLSKLGMQHSPALTDNEDDHNTKQAVFCRLLTKQCPKLWWKLIIAMVSFVWMFGRHKVLPATDCHFIYSGMATLTKNGWDKIQFQSFERAIVARWHTQHGTEGSACHGLPCSEMQLSGFANE